MVKYLITLFIGLVGIYSFGYYDKYSIVQINTFSGNKITSVFDVNGDSINASEVQFNQLHGYPAINGDCDGRCIAFHKNRFLAKYKNEYCLIDTNCQVIIDFCDTIEAIFLKPEIWFDDTKCDVFLKNPGYGYHVYYQAIKNAETFLYNNSGEKIFENSYAGLLFEEEYFHKGAEYYYTRNLDYSGFGLLDKWGNVILANNFGRQYSNHNNHCEIPSIYYVSFQTGVFNLKTKTWEIFDTSGFWIDRICNHVYLFHENNKYGLFDIIEGVIFPAEYDTIITPNIESCWNGIKPEPVILKRGKHTKNWNIPQKYWYVEQKKGG